MLTCEIFDDLAAQVAVRARESTSIPIAFIGDSALTRWTQSLRATLDQLTRELKTLFQDLPFGSNKAYKALFEHVKIKR